MHLQSMKSCFATLFHLTVIKTCARVLLEEEERRLFLKSFRRPDMENYQRTKLLKTLKAKTRKAIYCPHCSATNGIVKKTGVLKIIHDKFRAKKTADEMERWKKTFSSAVEAQKELGMFLKKAVHEDLNPLKVLDLFKRISDEVILSWLNIHSSNSVSGLRNHGTAAVIR